MLLHDGDGTPTGDGLLHRSTFTFPLPPPRVTLLLQFPAGSAPLGPQARLPGAHADHAPLVHGADRSQVPTGCSGTSGPARVKPDPFFSP